jgi:hypothetical protein
MPISGSPFDLPWASIVVNDHNRQLVVAAGLHRAMYLTVALSAALVLVLLAASWTVRTDYEKLQRWMKDNTAGVQAPG